MGGLTVSQYAARLVQRLSDKPKACVCDWQITRAGVRLTKINPACIPHKNFILPSTRFGRWLRKKPG